MCNQYPAKQTASTAKWRLLELSNIIMSRSIRPRERKRKICNKCGQQLSHSAFNRHLNPAVCPDPADESPNDSVNPSSAVAIPLSESAHSPARDSTVTGQNSSF